eukprot:TRINITY_DN6927_c0_g3_i2.p2 TRINITY_DN6927_c0_g3~~TRINITY_DN6927_c0_g3_i2.p2  ORF type:complete len:224 (+),score=23.50 TRINITY_DN6927_c0_g3_i2:767-1438(+)
MYGATASYAFVIRSFMKKFSFRFVCVSFGVSVLVFAYALQLAERPLGVKTTDFHLDSYPNALWCTVITMATVGYGDYYPRTTLGRIIAFIICNWGVLNTSLGVISINQYLEMSSLERKAYSTSLRLKNSKVIKQQAASLLIRFAQLGRRKGGVITTRELLGLNHIAKDFKARKRIYDSIFEESANTSEEFQRQMMLVNEEMKVYVRNQLRLSELLKELRSETE